MKIYSELESYQSEGSPLVVALGNFDGVHKGHQAILAAAKAHALRISGKVVVLTFAQHPQHVLGSAKPILLTSYDHKLALLAERGVDLCFSIAFTRDFSEKTPEEFVKEILIGKLQAKVVCMGAHARFGHHREGDARLMERLARENSFVFEEVGSVVIDAQAVSSTFIRGLIQKGSLREASRMLGRDYSFYGIVTQGAGRGAQMGFPTANLEPQCEVMPPSGVYAVLTDIIANQFEVSDIGGTFKKRYVKRNLRGVMNYGTRPTFKERTERLLPEVHLLDYESHSAGQTLEVKPLEKLRDEIQFPNQESLVCQIRQDIKDAEAVFASLPGAQPGHDQNQNNFEYRNTQSSLVTVSQ